MFIAYNFASRRDTEKLKTSLYFSRQDAPKYVSGGLEVNFKSWPQAVTFDPDTLWLNFVTLPKIRRIKI